MKVIYNKIIPFKGFRAINLFGVVFARVECRPLSEKTIRHEDIHTIQMKELWYIVFYLWYLIEWFIKLFIHGNESYYNISFEREAYANDSNGDYLKIRRKYEFLKYMQHEKN